MIILIQVRSVKFAITSHCMPDEIMEWIPDGNASEQQKKELEAEKAEYEKK